VLAGAVGAVESCLRLIGAADALRERIGSPRAPDVQAQLDRSVAPLRPTLGAAFDSLVDSGAALTGSQADAELLAVCRSAQD